MSRPTLRCLLALPGERAGSVTGYEMGLNKPFTINLMIDCRTVNGPKGVAHLRGAGTACGASISCDDRQPPPNSVRTFGRASWNRSNRELSGLLLTGGLAAAGCGTSVGVLAGCGPLPETLHSAATPGSMAVRRS